MSTHRSTRRAPFCPFRLLPREPLLKAEEPVHPSRLKRAGSQAQESIEARQALIAELEQRCRVGASRDLSLAGKDEIHAWMHRRNA